MELRSIFSSAPLLGLSGTVHSKVLADIKDVLQLDDSQVEVISLPPDRPNIYLEIKHQKSYDMEEDLLWVAEELSHLQDDCPKTIIFAQTIGQVCDIYEFLMVTLGRKAYQQGICDVTKRFVSMYHGQIATSLQQYTLNTFCESQSVLRVLVCTVAFGMGIEVANIRQVIHWGRSESVLSHWQEVGRCGRDGKAARAVWYPKSTTGKDKETFDVLKTNQELCIRKVFLDYFLLPGMDMTSIQELNSRKPCGQKCQQCKCDCCVCCSHCRAKCACTTNS